MDYRMYSSGAKAGENVVTLIKNELYKENGIMIHSPLKFIGFEGDPGTSFTLNNQSQKTRIPSAGSFITPYNGEQFVSIYGLVFDQDFNGDIYYIF